jgi:hypothetical protein
MGFVGVGKEPVVLYYKRYSAVDLSTKEPGSSFVLHLHARTFIFIIFTFFLYQFKDRMGAPELAGASSETTSKDTVVANPIMASYLAQTPEEDIGVSDLLTTIAVRG